MKNILTFLFVVIFICCKKIEIDKTNIQSINKITFIFKDLPTNVLKIKSGGVIKRDDPIYYIENNSFIKHTIKPTKKHDTISIKTNSNYIVVNHFIPKELAVNNSYIFEPNDTVKVAYNNGIPTFEVLNRNVLPYDVNNDISFEIPLNEFYFYLKNNRKRTESEMKKYYQEINQNFKQINVLFDSLYFENLISENYFKYKKNEIKYNEFSSRLNKEFNKYVVNEKPTDLTPKYLNNQSVINVVSYQTFLKKYAVEKFKIKTVKLSNRFLFDSKSAFDSVQNSSVFTGKAKEYLLYEYLIQIANDFSIDTLTEYFSKFKKETSDSLLINGISDTYLIDYSELKGETKSVHVLNMKKEKFTLKSTFNRYKGKLIYVDFWASWCAPCRAAMPSSKELITEYKNEDIVFLYVSIDKDFNKWKIASEEENIYFYNHNILALNYPNAEFYKDLKLTTIPRYLLFDKKGNLIHQNAPGPKNKEIRKIINKHLDK